MIDSSFKAIRIGLDTVFNPYSHEKVGIQYIDNNYLQFYRSMMVRGLDYYQADKSDLSYIRYLPFIAYAYMQAGFATMHSMVQNSQGLGEIHDLQRLAGRKLYRSDLSGLLMTVSELFIKQDTYQNQKNENWAFNLIDNEHKPAYERKLEFPVNGADNKKAMLAGHYLTYIVMFSAFALFSNYLLCRIGLMRDTYKAKMAAAFMASGLTGFLLPYEAKGEQEADKSMANRALGTFNGLLLGAFNAFTIALEVKTLRSSSPAVRILGAVASLAITMGMFYMIFAEPQKIEQYHTKLLDKERAIIKDVKDCFRQN